MEACTTHSQPLTLDGCTISIRVLTGVEQGQEIRLTGYGAPGENGGPNGDLFITFMIGEDSRYRPNRDDLYVTGVITLYTCIPTNWLRSNGSSACIVSWPFTSRI